MAGKKAYSRSGWRKSKPDHVNDHKIKFPEAVKEIIELSDIVLEVIDARTIEKTRNIKAEEMILSKGKKLIRVLNKADLINISEFKKNVESDKLEPYVLFSAKKKIGKERLKTLIKIEVKKAKIPYPIARVGIIGYPNTGKSTLINSLVGGGKVSTSSERGHTKAIQKIRFTKNIVLLDTPGVIPEGEDSIAIVGNLKRHVLTNVVRYDKVKDPDFIINDIMKNNNGVLQKHYEIETDDVEEFLEILGKRMNFLKKGGEIDSDRTARLVIKDVQEGKIKLE